MFYPPRLVVHHPHLVIISRTLHCEFIDAFEAAQQFIVTHRAQFRAGYELTDSSAHLNPSIWIIDNCSLDLNLILCLVRSSHSVEKLRNVYCDVV